MRHWNCWEAERIKGEKRRFLPYLWGIETPLLASAWLLVGRFLPYLWGIETRKTQYRPLEQIFCFYPTYEALKRLCLLLLGFWWVGFYPTYEALKQDVPNFYRVPNCRFLPYLWGIETPKNIHRTQWFYRFLPYLWGIETVNLQEISRIIFISFYPTYEALKLNTPKTTNPAVISVFTLPMRHWNLFLISVKLLGFLFLPYLWGIETVIQKDTHLGLIKFLPYLWGIETYHP